MHEGMFARRTFTKDDERETVRHAVNVREGRRGRERSRTATWERTFAKGDGGKTFARECSWGATFRATVKERHFVRLYFYAAMLVNLSVCTADVSKALGYG